MSMELRLLQEPDLPTRVAWFNDPRTYKQMAYSPPLSLDGTRRWYRSKLDDSSRVDLAFELNGQLVAMGGLTDLHEKNQNAELYVVVDPMRTGMGYGSEALKLILRHGFERLGLEKIYLYTRPGNEGARRLYERYGFTWEGTLRRHVWVQGELEDRIMHSILRPEWERLFNRGKSESACD